MTHPWTRIFATMAIVSLFVASHLSHARRLLYPLSDEPTVLLDRQSTLQIMSDWNNRVVHPEERPVRSAREMWVRLFPLLSNPLGDPYPDTVNVNELFIENSAGLKVYGLDDGALLASGSVLQFDFAARTVKVDGRGFVLEPVWIVPASGLTLAQWDKDKRGADGAPAEVRVRARGGFVVKQSRHDPRDGGAVRTLWSCINVVSVNDYLRSVVPSEVIAGWRTETLKAQAIAARTFGMYEAQVARAAGRDYDVDPSTWYQSYQGARFWNPATKRYRDIELTATNAAVTATGSKVIMYNGAVIRAFFSSNSGGRTCTTGECMDTGANVPYLPEVDDAPGVRSQPGGTWGSRANLTRAAIRARLIEIGVTPGAAISKLSHLEKGPSGRTWRMQVLLQDGSHIDLDRDQTRKMMRLFGPVRSYWYELGPVNSAGKQSIRGWGYGHGVGMSQYGAQLYARSGWTAERILQHFYANVTITSL